MDTIVTPGLVLKETRYKESDRIITLLTPGLGVISASAQSSLRLKSKLFSACGLFCYSEFVLVPGRNMYTVREADVKNVFHGISSSIEGMSLAMYMAEMASALSPTGDEAAKELRLLLNCFYMISEKKATNIAGQRLIEKYGRAYVEKYKNHIGIMWEKKCGKLIVDFDKYHKEINSVPVTDTSDGITVNEDNFPDRILTVEVDLRDGKSKIIKE